MTGAAADGAGPLRTPRAVHVRTAGADDFAEGTASYRSALEDEACCVLVATDVVGRVVGRAKTSLLVGDEHGAGDGHYLGGVEVDAAWRGRGIGRRLTEARLRWIAERADQAWYFTNDRNLASQSMHASFGFEPVAVAPAFFGVTFDGGRGTCYRTDLLPGAGMAGSRA